MTKSNLRLVVLGLMSASLVLPVYLVLRTGISEFLWLYPPIVTFWLTAYLEEKENSQVQDNNV